MASYPKYPSELSRTTTGTRAGFKKLLDTEQRINQYPYQPLNGWQVNQAVGDAHDFGERGHVPAWNFWAAFWDLQSPLVVAGALPDLETAVRARQDEMYGQLPLWLRNRRILAERLHWPAGVVEECEDLEARFPEWTVSWREVVGYVARLDVPMHRCDLSAQDPNELDVLMERVPLKHDYSLRGCDWCRSRL